MEHNDSGTDKRRAPRIEWNFTVQFKIKSDKDAYWETSAIKDISEKGCLFHSSVNFQSGEKLEMRILFPGMQEPMHFLAEVKHCELEEGKSRVYGAGVNFIEIDEEKKNSFDETLNFFLKRQKHNK